MKFSRVGQWRELSDCGCYMIVVDRVGRTFKYQAWLLDTPRVSLGTFEDAERARLRCKEHRAAPDPCCLVCGRDVPTWQGERCPACGGELGDPPKIYASEAEWLVAQGMGAR